MIEQNSFITHKRQLMYWRNLAPKPEYRNPLLQILAARPSLATEPRIVSYQWKLPAPVCNDILRVCNDSELSLYVLLVSMVKAVVARSTGEEVVSMLSPRYRPNDADSESTFVMLQNQVDLNEDLRSHILRTKRAVIGAYTNQSITLDEIFGHRLSETIVRNNPQCSLSNLHLLETDSRSPSPLELRFSLNDRTISCDVIYDAARLCPDRLREFCSNLQSFIEAASADYTVAVGKIEWLQGKRLEHVMALSKGPSAVIPNVTLHELFAEQASRTPQAPALIDDSRIISYQDLNALAVGAARHLLDLGVGQGDRVALQLSSGVDRIVVMLAVLKVGAAFAPIGLNEPVNRLRRMLEVAQPKIIVTDQIAQTLTDFEVVALSQLLAPRQAAITDELAFAVSADAAAYLIFTSGSTGQPKAVIANHQGIVNAVNWKIRAYGFCSEHRILPLFGYQFDGFVLNLFAPLCSGACVILASDQDLSYPNRTVVCIESNQVTTLITAPVLYQNLLSHCRSEQLLSLQSVTLAGEAADQCTVMLSKQKAPQVLLSNEYGPTEGTVVATCLKEMSVGSERTIGKPIDNVSVHILDSSGSPTPLCVRGEIFLAGPNLAQGYAGESELNQEGFVYIDQERLYQTCDLGMWLPNGFIEFQGRRDGYVKILGHRVDLSEIRSALLRHAAIKEAEVLLIEDITPPQLCAFVVAHAGARLPEVEAFLRSELPTNMFPNRLIAVDSMPLTAGGKIDIATLRQSFDKRALDKPNQQPANSVEQRLSQIWRNVLAIEHFDHDDSFFALGGHSLSAVRLLTEIHESFGIELRLTQVFSASSVKKLARVLSQQMQMRSAKPHSTVQLLGPAEGTLTHAQERMLAIASEHIVSYNLPLLFSLNANLDIPRFELALKRLVERNDALRASFDVRNGKWVQRFNIQVPLAVTEIELTDDIQSAAKNVLAPFNLETAPLFRIVLFTVQNRHVYLLFDFHHIIVDEISLSVILRELAMIYNGASEELASPSSYEQYSTAQQRDCSSEEYGNQLAAVVAKLSDAAIEPLRLPYDFPVPRKRIHEGGVVNGRFPEFVPQAIREFCAAEKVTEFMFYMAAFSILLHKFSDQIAFVIGAPVSLRSKAANRNLVGLCLNTVPFKFVVPTAATFREYLQTAAASIVEDLDTSQVDFNEIVKAMGLTPAQGENPIFSVMLNMVDNSATTLSLNGVETQLVPLHNGASKFDLILELDLADYGRNFNLEFASERFQESTIYRFRDSLVTLLMDIVAHPDVPIRELHVLSSADHQQLLHWSGNESLTTFTDHSVPSLFEQRVLERPNDVALVFGSTTMTYAELNARCNRIAHKLLSLGCAEDDVVAVFCERSFECIVAIMAVQKAGAAHMPLDPFYPTARTQKMLSDCLPKVLITDQDVSSMKYDGIVLGVDEDFSMESNANPDIKRRPESLAYVLYTSGTTGGPKGVMVEQRNLIALINLATRYLEINLPGVWTLFHSVCFDVSVWEMFAALLTGSRLVIVPRSLTSDPVSMLALIQKNRTTVLCEPPSAFYLLADTIIRSAKSTSVQVAILGGEAIKPENLKQWLETYPEVKVVNGYGITETTVYSTFKIYTQADIHLRTGSIGRPIPGSYVYVLDSNLQMCPVGVIGELHIGGLGVGRGYLRQKELTRRKFVDDPFLPGRKLYRSGDLVRWLENGEIEYICRADKQVKVRGYRVELAEIESQMSAFAKIGESVVLAEPLGSTNQLLGYFTCDSQVDTDALRNYLEKNLPNYMVPTRLLQLDRIPVTPNGKVDRTQLLSLSSVETSKVQGTPLRDLEVLVRRTWSEILGLSEDNIGATDSFFALGGDSIGASLVVRMLQNQGLVVEVLDLFENPKLRAFADLMTTNTPEVAGEALASSAVTVGYWDEIAAAKVSPLIKPLDQFYRGEVHRISTQFPLQELRGALALADGYIDLPDVFLSTILVAARMWSGVDACRVWLLSTSESRAKGDERFPIVHSAVLPIKNINLIKEQLETVHELINRAQAHGRTWQDIVANAAYAEMMKGGLIFRFRHSDENTSAEPDPFFTNEFSATQPILNSAAVLADCVANQGQATLTLVVAAKATDVDRFRFFTESLNFVYREIVHSHFASLPQSSKSQVCLDVQPFSEVFVKDCTHQAMVAAMQFFGRNEHLLLANLTTVCVRDLGRKRGLRVYLENLERRPLVEIFKDAGISIEEHTYCGDICEQLQKGLSQGHISIVKIDCYFVKRQLDLYQKRHGDHTILVCGFDQRQRVFEIIDNQAARDIQYCRTTIDFDEIQEAYEGYQRMFNSRRKEVSLMILSESNETQLEELSETAIRATMMETLELSFNCHEEEQAAMNLSYADFCAVSASDELLLQHVEQLSYTYGELLSAKRLLSYQVERILRHQPLAQLVNELVACLESIYLLLTKLRLAQCLPREKVDLLGNKMIEAKRLANQITESFKTLLEAEPCLK